MRRTVIACETIEGELQRLLPPGVELRVLDRGLHQTPRRLTESIQREIDSANADEVLLGYGLCGGGIAGLRASNCRLVVPRVDDCISILLGSAERYREEFQREPGTYWLSEGWIENARDPYREYQRSREKYGEETARWLAAEMMRGYRRLALIDTGVCPVDRLRGYAREFAAFFRLEYVEMVGSDALLRSLLFFRETAPGLVVVVEPGGTVSADSFLPALATING